MHSLLSISQRIKPCSSPTKVGVKKSNFNHNSLLSKTNERILKGTKINENFKKTSHSSSFSTFSKPAETFNNSWVLKNFSFPYAFGLGLASILLFQQTENEESQEEKVPGEVIQGLPEYTLEEISKHKTVKDRIWVCYKDGVYDITEFVESHPGGTSKIMLAAGSSIEPYWKIYQIHQNTGAWKILEEYRIGNVAASDRGKFSNISVPGTGGLYDNEPYRLDALVVRSKQPFNAETPSSILVENYITPNELFFVRNHMNCPVVDPSTYTLTISGEGIKTELKLTLDDLKQKFAHKTIDATLSCTGNRRSELNQVKEVKGLAWAQGAISTATWTGVLLSDILEAAGFDPKSGAVHVQFEGIDKDIENKVYGASIPIEKAINKDNDVLLAFEMNGEELPRDHGFPVRVVVPGHAGARSVKWLTSIKTSDKESGSFWQQRDYRVFPPWVDPNAAVWEEVPSVQEIPVTSAIIQPTTGETIKPGEEIEVKGYAWSGNGRGIVRVDISSDGGVTWSQAEIVAAPKTPNLGYKRWGWTLWRHSVVVPPGTKEVNLVCRAVDSANNHQPHDLETVWNFRGLLNNSWHRVKVKIEENI